MSKLMLSLDKKIFNPKSGAALRMIDLGQQAEQYILIPDKFVKGIDLSSHVHVLSSGGKSKFTQFKNLKLIAAALVKEKNITSITTQDPFFLGLVGLDLKKKFNLPLEVQIHGDFYGNEYYRRTGVMNKLRYSIGKFVLPKATTVRAVSGRVKKGLIDLGLNEENIVIKPVKINRTRIQKYHSKFSLKNKYPKYNKIFLCLGRLDPVKNIAWLLGVFSQVTINNKRALLLIVGEGKEQQRLRRIVKKLGLEKNVKLVPWTIDPYSYLKGADCLLFPSLSESYGLVVVEAVAAGTKVIMNDVGVANFELQPSDSVQIISVEEKHKWVEAILSL